MFFISIVGICTLNAVLALGVASGCVTSAASSIAKYGWHCGKNNELTKLLEKDCQITEEIFKSFHDLCDELKKIQKIKYYWLLQVV